MSSSTVPSAVICGVTSSESVASTYWTVTVWFATVWIGSRMPLWMCAFSLFWAVTLGEETTLTRPSFSAAASVKSRLKESRMSPKANWRIAAGR